MNNGSFFILDFKFNNRNRVDGSKRCNIFEFRIKDVPLKYSRRQTMEMLLLRE